ncbi:hypothetical protein DASC09_034250 [Saccharomycopsis crataegensis]|uniref:ubiquitinyl hydrolase 1 n=1 Tax=Saccharomycopsis crataegensis TaxID=43959 RepID=A0AAV5QMB1_9ASCO|nr:hypothetical protein DASC09_034250 [Saccharomycopsis crataegensis]
MSYLNRFASRSKNVSGNAEISQSSVSSGSSTNPNPKTNSVPNKNSNGDNSQTKTPSSNDTGNKEKSKLKDNVKIFDDNFWSSFKQEIIKNDKSKDGGEKKQSGSKVMVLKNLFEKQKTTLCPSQANASLLCEFSNKDVTKAYELIRYFNICEEGSLVCSKKTMKTGNRSKITLLGAENWGNVMCYLDSLLFSMFAKLESFEPLLMSFASEVEEDVKVRRLRAILRVYVSLLRSGQLITFDLTRLLCESLAECGFQEAISRKQEDSSQLFIFLTEILQMPLLTLKIDIAHGGKEVAQDDHRYAKERMLYVSIPEPEDMNDEGTVKSERELEEDQDVSSKAKVKGNAHKQDPETEAKPHIEHEESVLLEECLEHYFNNSIHVKRQLERRLSLRRGTITQQLESLQEIKGSSNAGSQEDLDKPVATYIEELEDPCEASHKAVELVKANNISDDDDDDNVEGEDDNNGSLQGYKMSELGTVTYEGDDKETDTTLISPTTKTVPELRSSFDNSNMTRNARSPSLTKDANYHITTRSRANSAISIFSENKSGEVSLPAWMFLQLLPFYTDLEPNSETEQSFAEKHPILPICLKRYTFGKNSKKSTQKIIIPSFIDLPNFIAENSGETGGDTKEADTLEKYGKYRLILESAVCHRGHSINSGHYVSLVRDEAFDPNATEDEEDNRRWLLFDDLSEDGRVKPTTFKEAFSKETPYILLYRMDVYIPKIVTSIEDDDTTTEVSGKLDKLQVKENRLDGNGNDDADDDDEKSKKQVDDVLQPPANDRKKSSNSTISMEQQPVDNSEHESTTTGGTKKSHDLFSKMVFYNSTYPYPNSSDYSDIRDRFYWKTKTEDGLYIEDDDKKVGCAVAALANDAGTPPYPSGSAGYLTSDSSFSSRLQSKRNSWNDNSSNRSIYSDMDLEKDGKADTKEGDGGGEDSIYSFNGNLKVEDPDDNDNEEAKSKKVKRINSGVSSLWSKKRLSIRRKSKNSDISSTSQEDSHSDAAAKPSLYLHPSKEKQEEGEQEEERDGEGQQTPSSSSLSQNIDSNSRPFSKDSTNSNDTGVKQKQADNSETKSLSLPKADENMDQGLLNPPPSSSTALQSSRSSYESSRKMPPSIATEVSESASNLRGTHSKSSKTKSGSKVSKYKRKNTDKIKREKYRNEKCLIM